MTTPAEFLACTISVIEQLALLYAHSPDDKAQESLEQFLTEIRVDWTERFNAIATPEEIAEVAAEIGERVQERRREIEAGGWGIA
ncbi:hypothetical protein [uncultured Rhodoblastus sp.]|uniref:hypothetical protein n=1 Tax=uncultured Rhodoblastus sp. TaxID=543037 RepID=UPI0025FA9F39|nr:hypothetical protein [uncultured Rhodoblastus sp.]